MEIAFVALQNEVALRWHSVSGRSYTLEYKSSLNPGSQWEILEDNIAGSDGVTERSTPALPPCFFRLSVKKN